MKAVLLFFMFFGAFAQVCLADNPTPRINISTCGQVTSTTDNSGFMSDEMNLNFIVEMEAVNYLKAHVPNNLLLPYLGPNTTPADHINFYQSVLSYLQGYCQAHPFVSFETAEQALAQELVNNHK